MTALTPGELLQRDVDGESTPEEAAALARLVREHPALREKHEALKRVVAELRRVRMAEAPQGLAADVRREVRVRALRPFAGWGQFQAALTRKPALGHAMSLAAGLIIGAVGVALSDPTTLFSRADAPSAGGAMLPRGRLESPGELDRRRLSLAGFAGHAATRMSEGHVVAEVEVDSGGPVDVTIEFDPRRFAPVAFRLDDGARGAASLVRGRLHLAAETQGTYRLVLAPTGPERPSLHLRLQAMGALLEEDLRTANDR